MGLRSDKGRLVYATCVGLAFLGTGLYFGGAAGRVHALARAAASSPPMATIEGSRVLSAQTVAFDGQPARMARCLAPPGMSVEDVRSFYEKLAQSDSTLATPVSNAKAKLEALPYVASDQPGGAFLAWISAKTAHRRGVIVQGDASGIEYVLLDAGPLEDDVNDETARGRVALPGGILAPPGSRRGLQMEEPSRAFSFVELRSSPEQAAVELAQAAEQAGYKVDAEAKAELDTVRAGPRVSASRIVVPFEGKGRRGVFIVSGADSGGSRATFALR